MSNFETFVTRVLEHEGGFVNHPRDPGKATNFGITQRVARAHGFTGDMRNLPRSKAIEIYRTDYWQAIRGEELPPAVAWQVMDCAVNHGVRRAIQFLQRAVGTTPDGIFGPKTLAAAKAADAVQVVLMINAARLQFYTELDTWATFGKGWVRRASGNLLLAAKDVTHG